MHILIGLGLGVVLLYFWLIGHWFARILMLPVFAISTLLLAGWVIASSTTGAINPGIAVMAWLASFALAWPLSGIPTYVARHRARNASLELSLR